MEWKDATSYNKYEKNPRPTVFALDTGYVRISIVWGHIYHPNEWVMNCHTLGLDCYVLGIDSYDGIDDAKRRAVHLVKIYLSRMIQSIEKL